MITLLAKRKLRKSENEVERKKILRARSDRGGGDKAGGGRIAVLWLIDKKGSGPSLFFRSVRAGFIMLLLRAVFLECLLCLHVVGAAVLFRRLFPQESPWICFLVPILALLSVLNFIEHFVALPDLGWLLPLTLGGSLWVILKPGFSWEGLRFPAILFVGIFTFTFGLRCIFPDVSNANEGVSNYTRVLNYFLGGTLPPKDCWLPPFDYGGYYSFQHYGAAILKRLFSIDVGTAYNVSFAFLLAWLCLMGAGVAHSLTGSIWVSLGTVLVLLGAWTGSFPYLIFFGPHQPDYGLSINLNADWNRPENNPFSWLCSRDKYHPDLILESPTINLYWSEFHSTLGGNFVTIASVLASSEVFRRAGQNWSWICLMVLPMVVIVTSAWFFLIIAFLCVGSLILALIAGRRPEDWRLVIFVSALAAVLLWPFVFSVTGLPTPEEFRWTLPEDRTALWIFAVQWWPVFLPWLFLCFVWTKMDLRSRWIHAALPMLYIGAEVVTFGDRKMTTEKMWAGIYGIGLVTVLPMIFARPGVIFRLFSAFLLLISAICLRAALIEYYPNPLTANNLFQLQGDSWVRDDVQKQRLLEVMQRLKAATILPGKSYWNYSQAAAVVSFSGNKCFVAYIINELYYGRRAEAYYRNEINNEFYDGKMADPLALLSGENIDAVLIWPEDAISDQLLQKFKDQLKSEFFYVDCKMDGPNNAGLFVRQAPLKDSLGATARL
jgi:hypothetical protein